MLLPENVQPIEFWKQAKQKGIKITSRFNGVCFSLTYKKLPCWLVRYQAHGKFKYIGRYEFSIYGEVLARKAYLDYLESIGVEERYKLKKTSKLKKSNKP